MTHNNNSTNNQASDSSNTVSVPLPDRARAAEMTTTLMDLEQGIPLLSPLTAKQRRKLVQRLAVYGEPLIERLAQYANAHGGMIAGVPFDGALAQSVLDYARAFGPVAQLCATVGYRFGDDVAQHVDGVIDHTSVVMKALRTGVKKDPTLLPLLNEVLALKPVRRRKKAKDAQQSDTSTSETAPTTPTTPAAPATPPAQPASVFVVSSTPGNGAGPSAPSAAANASGREVAPPTNSH